MNNELKEKAPHYNLSFYPKQLNESSDQELLIYFPKAVQYAELVDKKHVRGSFLRLKRCVIDLYKYKQ